MKATDNNFFRNSTMLNDLYPTTKGMTNREVSDRQSASRRVTVTTRRVPTAVRFATPKRLVTNADEK